MCRGLAPRGEQTVTIQTNTRNRVCIESDGIICILNAGQQQSTWALKHQVNGAGWTFNAPWHRGQSGKADQQTPTLISKAAEP